MNLAVKKCDGKNYAIKTIDKTKVSSRSSILRSVEREITLLRRTSHPHIVKLFEVYENDLYIHLVLEYVGGGELFKRKDSCGLYSEKEVQHIARCVLEALDYCHALHIVHRDLKPENIVFVYNSRQISLGMTQPSQM